MKKLFSRILKWSPFAILCTLTSCLLFYLVLLIHPNLYYDLREVLNPNTMQIIVENGLSKKKVNVYFGSDFTKNGRLIKDGENTSFVYKDYGPNQFIITYEKDTIGYFSYVKTNNYHGHNHLITISKPNETIKCAIKITGPDSN